MKRLLALVLGLVVIGGAVSAWAPIPVVANVKDPDRCGGLGACSIEAGECPSCPPCYYYEYCRPQCGCRPIPGCKTEEDPTTVAAP